MLIIETLTVGLVILIILNIALALYNMYYPRITTLTCNRIKLPDLPNIAEQSSDEHGHLQPAELELNPSILQDDQPVRDLPLSEYESNRSAIVEAFPDPPKIDKKIFKFDDSDVGQNRRYSKFNQRSVLGQQERDGYQ